MAVIPEIFCKMAQKPEPAHVKPAKPEPAHVKPAKPEPAHVKPAKPEPAHVKPAKPEPAHVKPVKPAKPEPVHIKSAKPEPVHIRAIIPEPCPVMAAIPESRPIMSTMPSRTKSVPRHSKLASNMDDPPLMSVRVAGYTANSPLPSHADSVFLSVTVFTHSSDIVPQEQHLQSRRWAMYSVLPVMAMAILCVWAAHTTLVSPKAATSTAEPPEAHFSP
ncbi:anti-sigma-I factor RsgI8-like [Cyprinus carpio]|uniref:Anti-sigma-I factor RsgI8-like n=1 Tax=Cyprinus carpio TaxID=7962 RepID=A0A9Q9VTB7_CYPCA|nr:anti-sigma-I factor RsgI8-like [Cyprinus carpio]